MRLEIHSPEDIEFFCPMETINCFNSLGMVRWRGGLDRMGGEGKRKKERAEIRL